MSGDVCGIKYEVLNNGGLFSNFTLVPINKSQEVKEIETNPKVGTELQQPLIEASPSLALLKKGNIAYFIQQYGVYPPPVQQRFKNDELLMCTLDSVNTNSEIGYPGNDSDKKQTSICNIMDELIYQNSDTPVDAQHLIWVMDKNSKLYISESSGSSGGVHHSYFLKKEGFGKPLACGGHMSIKQGKIIEIDNSSGHYKPNTDQLILAAHAFYKKGILSEDVKIHDHNINRQYTYSDIASVKPQEILKNYQELV